MNNIKRKAFENEIKQAKINIQLGNIDLAFKQIKIVKGSFGSFGQI